MRYFVYLFLFTLSTAIVYATENKEEKQKINITTKFIVGKTKQVTGELINKKNIVLEGNAIHKKLSGNKTKVTIHWKRYHDKFKSKEKKRLQKPIYSAFVTKPKTNLQQESITLKGELEIIENIIESKQDKFANSTNNSNKLTHSNAAPNQRANNNGYSNNSSAFTPTSNASTNGSSATNNQDAAKNTTIAFSDCPPLVDYQQKTIKTQIRKQEKNADETISSSGKCYDTGQSYNLSFTYDVDNCSKKVELNSTNNTYKKYRNEKFNANGKDIVLKTCVLESKSYPYVITKDYNECKPILIVSSNEAYLSYKEFTLIDSQKTLISPQCKTDKIAKKIIFSLDKCSPSHDFINKKSAEKGIWHYTDSNNVKRSISECVVSINPSYTYKHLDTQEGCTPDINEATKVVTINTRIYYANYANVKNFISECVPSNSTKALVEEPKIIDSALINNNINSDAFIHNDTQSQRIVNFVWRDYHNNGRVYKTAGSINQKYVYMYVLEECTNYEHDDAAMVSYKMKKKGFYIAGKFIKVQECTKRLNTAPVSHKSIQVTYKYASTPVTFSCFDGYRTANNVSYVIQNMIYTKQRADNSTYTSHAPSSDAVKFQTGLINSSTTVYAIAEKLNIVGECRGVGINLNIPVTIKLPRCGHTTSCTYKVN